MEQLTACIATLLDELENEYGVTYYTGINLYLHTEDADKNSVEVTGRQGEPVSLKVSHPDKARNRKMRKKKAPVLDFARAKAARRKSED